MRSAYRSRLTGFTCALAILATAGPARASDLDDVPFAPCELASADPERTACFEPIRFVPHPRGVGFQLRDANGVELGEADFARRYRETTGAFDLQPLERDRDGGFSMALGIASLAGVGLSGVLWSGLLLPTTARASWTQDQAITATIFSIALTGAWFVSLDGRDGVGRPNKLSPEDARRSVRQYNLAAAQRAGHSTTTFRLTLDTSPGAGAEVSNALSLARAMLWSVDAGLREVPATAGFQAGARIAQVALVDLAVASFTLMASHEVLGHAARASELGRIVDRVHLSAPAPWNLIIGEPLDGRVSWNATTRPQEEALIFAAGMQVETSMRRALVLAAGESGALRHGDAMLYSALVLHLGALAVGWENDLTRHSGWADAARGGGNAVGAEELARWMVGLTVIDPFLAYALFLEFFQFPFHRELALTFPTFRTYGVQWVPTHRSYALPWGHEQSVGALLFQPDRFAADVELRVGLGTAARSGGVSIRIDPVRVTERLRLRGGLDVLVQPMLEGKPWAYSPVWQRMVLGAEVGLETRFGAWSVGIGAGAKTAGVVDQEPIQEAWKLQATVGFHSAR